MSKSSCSFIDLDIYFILHALLVQKISEFCDHGNFIRGGPSTYINSQINVFFCLFETEPTRLNCLVQTEPTRLFFFVSVVTPTKMFCYWLLNHSKKGKRAGYNGNFLRPYFFSIFFQYGIYTGQIDWHIEFDYASSNMPTFLSNIFHISLNSVL